MKTRFLFFVVLPVFLLSCTRGQNKQFQDFGEEKRWTPTDVRTFQFDIADDTKAYDLIFRFSHVYGYQFASVPVHFQIENPQGEKDEVDALLVLRDTNNKEKGDCLGDICDFDYPLKTNVKFAKGSYTVRVEQNFKNAPYLPNVIGVGLNIEPSEK